MSYKITLGKDKYHLHSEITQWCRDHIGNGGPAAHEPDKLWDMVMAFGNSTYYFKNEKDLAFFMLRWI